jgi:Na+/H+ antiporter NhaD/arsenite permease-like protein
MKHSLKIILIVLLLFFNGVAFADANNQESGSATQLEAITNQTGEDGHQTGAEEHNDSNTEEHQQHAESPATWSVIPFVLLLLMIATGPLFYPHFWHKRYPFVAAFLGAIVVIYYLFFLGDTHHPIHSGAEYFSFIALIAALFIASGGILIKVDKEGTPMVNVMILLLGAVIANLIGTTGASMLLIRPFIRLNKARIKPYHIVFFIFIISNVGGSLTPIGDPPLFLGFLKGVPFFWTVEHLFLKWAFGIGLLTLIFYYFDKRNHSKSENEVTEYSGKIEIKGLRNVIFLVITIIAVFIDPNVIKGVPALKINGIEVSFVREVIMLLAAFFAYKTADKECLKGNEFDFEPIKEVGFLFIGIFATMMPALQLIGEFAHSETGTAMVNVHSLYWATGSLSGVLDNAPTYLNFLAAGMGKFGLDISSSADVTAFVNGYPQDLIAISVAAVFFGAFTYIGNAPNFMVKSIAEQVGVQMPSFVGYIIRYAIPILLPVLFLTWLVFFAFG